MLQIAAATATVMRTRGFGSLWRWRFNTVETGMPDFFTTVFEARCYALARQGARYEIHVSAKPTNALSF
jgi:hypothetical protein